MVAHRELYGMVPGIPQYLDWSDSVISFDQSDHPDYVPHPGKVALVFNLIIDGSYLNKVLMDGGSIIDILYLKTMEIWASHLLDLHQVPWHCAG